MSGRTKCAAPAATKKTPRTHFITAGLWRGDLSLRRRNLGILLLGRIGLLGLAAHLFFLLLFLCQILLTLFVLIVRFGQRSHPFGGRSGRGPSNWFVKRNTWLQHTANRARRTRSGSIQIDEVVFPVLVLAADVAGVALLLHRPELHA